MASPDPDAASVERLLLRTASALIAFLLAGGIGFALARDEELVDAVATGDGGAALERAAIGPLPGATLDAYERSARRRLSAAGERHIAVISFRRYLTEGDARQVAPKATALLVAAPHGGPRMVSDLAAWADEERSAAEAEKAELESLIPTVDDPAFATQYRRDIDRLERLLERIDPKGRIVFGAVVEGDAAELRAIAKEEAVRLVDVAAADAGQITTFRGIRPEERDVANEPPTRP
jgi:hypothetical protein